MNKFMLAAICGVLCTPAFAQDEDPNAVYCCLNHSEAYCPRQIEDRSICLGGDAGALFKVLQG